jgi:TetR/AcrR family transcriptional repressor of nem operon
MAAKSTRDHLIEVGLGLMHQHGYNATGLNDILKTADVPKGSFYHHFGSKDDFAAAALAKYTSRAAAHSAAVLNDSKSLPLTRLKRYFLDLIRMYGQNGPIPGCLVARLSLEIPLQNPQLRNQISTAFAHWQGTIAAVIRQAVAQEQVPADTDPESLAGFLLNSWEGALLRSQADNNDAPLETFMRYVFDGLLTKEPNAENGRSRR